MRAMSTRHPSHVALVLACGLTVLAAFPSGTQSDPDRRILASDDGFAALGEGTTGGASADEARVFTVRSRAELAAALNAAPADVPRIIRVDGVIDVNVDDSQPAARLRGLSPRRLHARGVSVLLQPGRPLGTESARQHSRLT